MSEIKTAIIVLYRRLFVRPSFFSFHHHLFTFALRGMGILNAEGPQATGEAWLARQLARTQSVHTIVDVGANLDLFGVSEFPRAHLYAIEPHPRTFATLRKMYSAKKYSHIHPLQLAISNRNGSAKLWDFADDAPLKLTQPTSTLSSLHREVIEKHHRQKAQSFSVRTMTIDTLMAKYHLQKIDILKIDTEGHEYEVLQGAHRALRNNAITTIIFEFNEMHAYRRRFLRDFIELLPNYTLYRLLPNGLQPLNAYRPLTHEIFGFQNIVALLNYV